MSTDSERDQSIDRILRQGARQRSAASDMGGEACLDAETFAAWAEGSLPEGDAARVEAHLSDCTRCQALMASFATTEPAAATGAAPAVIPFRSKSPMRWLIPVIAGTAAASLLVWTAWPKPGANVPSSETTMAKADAPVATPTPPAPGELASATPPAQRDAKGPAELLKSERSQAQPKLAEAQPVDRRGEKLASTSRVANETPAKPLPAPPPAPTPPPYTPAPRPLPAAIPPPPGTVVGAAATTQSAPPTQAQQQTQQAQQGTVRTEVPTGSMRVSGSSDVVQTLPRADRNALNFLTFVPGTVEFGPADPAVARDRSSTVAMGRGGAGGSAAGGGGGGRAAASVAERSVPVTNIRWRILPTGQVGKSTDAGATWQAIALEPTVHITQGAAPSADVCWLVGKAGVVLLSIDGTKFRPLAFPEAVDLQSITAIDALRATVTTTTGRTFTTTDAGGSWK